MKDKAYVGVDLHSDSFTVCYLNKKKFRYETFDFNTEGIDAFKKTLSKEMDIALEAVANAPYFRDQIRKRVNRVTIVAPGDFAAISKSAKKTDKNDAHTLAKFLSKDMIPKARIKSEKSRRLLTAIDTRAQLVKAKLALINKAYALLLQQGIKLERRKLLSEIGLKKNIFCKKWRGIVSVEFEVIYEQIQSLRRGIKKLDKEIEGAAKEYSGYENIISIKGIGALSAATLLAVIDDIQDFERPELLASYFGIVPRVRQSNDNNPSLPITKRGSKIGRTALIQCTWVTIKYSPYLRSYYNRIKKRRGTGRAIVACSRKLLTIIFNTLKNNWIFEDFTKYKYRVKGVCKIV